MSKVIINFKANPELKQALIDASYADRNGSRVNTSAYIVRHLESIPEIKKLLLKNSKLGKK